MFVKGFCQNILHFMCGFCIKIAVKFCPAARVQMFVLPRRIRRRQRFLSAVVCCQNFAAANTAPFTIPVRSSFCVIFDSFNALLFYFKFVRFRMQSLFIMLFNISIKPLWTQSVSRRRNGKATVSQLFFLKFLLSFFYRFNT